MQTIMHPPTRTPLIYKIGVVSTLISLMAGALTGLMTYVTVGYTDAFGHHWLASFGLAIGVMVPLGVFTMAALSRLLAKVMHRHTPTRQNIVSGALMALIMESLLAASTAWRTTGLANISEYGQAWFTGFISALPVGLCLSITMALWAKPRLQRFMAS